MRKPIPARSRLGFLGGSVLVVTLICIGAVLGLVMRPNADPGIRVWMLNHTPDQALVINPYSGQVEKRLLVADGLREMGFSRDGDKAYIANVVDVSNRLKVINTTTYLTEDEIEVDGVPQGIGVFPDDSELAVILGSKTDFMAGGFDVLDLDRRSEADQLRRVRLYRERDLSLTHKLAVGDDGDRIYCIDAKQPLVNIYSRKAKAKVGEVNLGGAPEELHYPPAGDYYYVSVLQHYAVYQLDKKTDQLVAAYDYILHDPDTPWEPGKLRYIAVDNTGDYLFASCMEDDAIAVWQVGNPEYKVVWEQQDPEKFVRLDSFRRIQEHYLPKTSIKLSGYEAEGISYIPGPKQLAVDSMNTNLFVVDEDGALYIYHFNDVINASPGELVKPVNTVTEIEGEMRDMKVSRPVLDNAERRKARAEAEG